MWLFLIFVFLLVVLLLTVYDCSALDVACLVLFWLWRLIWLCLHFGVAVCIALSFCSCYFGLAVVWFLILLILFLLVFVVVAILIFILVGCYFLK